MCTRPLIVLIIAYLDWLKSPSIEKNILESNIRIRWYSTIESTESTKNIEGPHIKFNEKSSCEANRRERKIGAITVAGLGIIKISLESILKRSAKIWKAPLRPISVGPIRRWAKANNLRSVKITNSVSSTSKKEDNNANSCKD